MEARDYPSITYSYDRRDEVKKECRDVLSQASKLTPDDNRVFRIKNELSFVNGDWEQENNGAPLIPFDDRDTPKEKNSNGSFAGKPYEGSPQFQMWPGSSALIILFQGVYVESDENGGERVMCLLGNTVLPSRQPDSTDPWDG
ncbi:hypothetical protein GIB67_041488 [Kingdonia uniflora]|uniref:Uncharacterized protein n=1 Tax=Kingdonia uniflora TaxID=39325 RepID=A0A7J7LQS9_9MAGN|nr:hypothetical protein GIB67_041488 [Kingdonia uniflora]